MLIKPQTKLRQLLVPPKSNSAATLFLRTLTTLGVYSMKVI